MATIEEEMKQSRQAADEITKTDTDSERRKQRAEGMARASGGISVTNRRNIQSEPGAILSSWLGHVPKDVREGKTTQKKFRERENKTNYTGMINLDKVYNGQESTSLGTNKYATEAEDDFVSAWFNNHTPLKEYGVRPIDKANLPLYRGLFSPNYGELVNDDGFRGYQVKKEYLDNAPILDSLANEGKYTYKPVEMKKGSIDPTTEQGWRIGDTDTLYDSNGFTKISVIHDGKRYSKNLDVFDVDGLDKYVPIAGSATKFIAKNAKRYFVSSPWYEDPVQPSEESK